MHTVNKWAIAILFWKTNMHTSGCGGRIFENQIIGCKFNCQPLIVLSGATLLVLVHTSSNCHAALQEHKVRFFFKTAERCIINQWRDLLKTRMISLDDADGTRAWLVLSNCVAYTGRYDLPQNELVTSAVTERWNNLGFGPNKNRIEMMRKVACRKVLWMSPNTYNREQPRAHITIM